MMFLSIFENVQRRETGLKSIEILFGFLEQDLLKSSLPTLNFWGIDL